MVHRCFLGCPNALVAHLHVFPSPERFPEQFKKWVQIVGGELNTPDDYVFYRKKRICDRHFTIKDRNRNNRLNALAVPSLRDETTTIYTIENSPTDKPEPASYSTAVDPLQGTEDPIAHTSITVDAPSPQASEGFISCPSPTVDVPSAQASEGFVSCPSPIVDVPSPQAEEVIISCSNPIVDDTPPKTTVAQRALYTGSDVFSILKHTYSKLPLPEKCNVTAPDVYNENAVLSVSNDKSQKREIRMLKRQINALQKRCKSYRQRLAEASKPSVAFQKVTKYMTEPAKLFTKMQFTQTHKRPAGRRFTSEEKDFSLLLYKTSPQYYSFLAQCFTLPSKKTLKAMLAQEKLEPYLTLDKSLILPSNKTVVQEKLQPYLTLEKNSALPPKITLQDILARENVEPHLTLKQNSSLPLKITLKDILAHKQLEPYFTLKNKFITPTKITLEKEKPEPQHTLKKKSTSPSKKALKGILARENVEPHLTLEQNSSFPLKITLKDILAHKQLEPYLTLKKKFISPTKITLAKEKPEPQHTLKKKSTSPSKKDLKGVLVQENLEPYLTFNKNISKTYLGKRKPRIETE